MNRSICNTLLSVVMLSTLMACEAPKTPVASGASIEQGRSNMPRLILQKKSAYNFEVTVARIRAAINARPLNLFGEVKHSVGAQKVELDLAPSTLFIFGNPKGGTPLMSRNPEMGIELPLKIHVFEKDGQVTVSYTNIEAVAVTYGLDATLQPIPNISAMLEGLVGSVLAK